MREGGEEGLWLFVAYFHEVPRVHSVAYFHASGVVVSEIMLMIRREDWVGRERTR